VSAGATGVVPAARAEGRQVARSLPALLALLLVTLPLVALPAGPAAAANGVRVEVSSLSPAFGAPGGTLRVAGTVTNGGRQPLSEVVVRLRLSQSRLGSRSELAAVVQGEVTSRDGDVVAEQPVADLSPGGSAPFALSRGLDGLDALTEFGVYVLGVEVVGVRGKGGDVTRLDIARTLLPWVPSTDVFSPTGFSWVWPLVAAPVRKADGTFADDSLAGELAPGGRLDRLLQAGARLDQGAAVTWAIDPDLLDAVRDMADDDGYEVTADDGTVPGGGAGLARSWLEQLQVVTAGAQVLPLPYADVDSVALVRHGVPADLAKARALGQQLLTGMLPSANIVTELAWPAGGYVDRATLSAMARDGATGVVLDGRAQPPTIDLSYTPSARSRLYSDAGPVAALLADPGLADELAAARPEGGQPVLAAQRVVAETAMIAAELPSTGTGRTIVAMPPRRWDPSQAFLDQLVTVAQAPWTAPVTLRELAADELPEVDREPLRYPAGQRRTELPDAWLTAMDRFRSQTALLSAVLTDRTQYVPGLQRSLMRLESTYWRGREDARVIRNDREKTYLSGEDGLLQAVRVQPGSFTFGSRSGKIPITLVNDLAQPVRVDLRLVPQTPRLRLQPVSVPEIGANRKIQVEVDASAVAGGQVVVEAGLRTRGGAQFGNPVSLQVRITQIGTVALAITVGAAVVLFLAAGVRVVRRIRHRGPDGAPPAPPEQPADVAA
jgi:hypothetical protein